MGFANKTLPVRPIYENATDGERDYERLCRTDYGFANDSCPFLNDTFLDLAVASLKYGHCYESSQTGRGYIDATVIAFVHNDNEIGYQMEIELAQLFKYQKFAYDNKLARLTKENRGFLNSTNR